MQKARLQLVGRWFGLIAFIITICIPQISQAGGLDDSRPNLIQCINPGSYSPCHWWAPSYYRCRAYHRPARLYDQSQWDGGGSYYSGSGGQCQSPNPVTSPQEKAESKKETAPQ